MAGLLGLLLLGRGRDGARVGEARRELAGLDERVELGPAADDGPADEDERQVGPADEAVEQAGEDVGVSPGVGVDVERPRLEEEPVKFGPDEARVGVALLGKDDDGVVVPQVVLELRRREGNGGGRASVFGLGSGRRQFSGARDAPRSGGCWPGASTGQSRAAATGRAGPRRRRPECGWPRPR